MENVSPDDGILKEGSNCNVREGRMVHTNGKVADCGKYLIVCVCNM